MSILCLCLGLLGYAGAAKAQLQPEAQTQPEAQIQPEVQPDPQTLQQLSQERLVEQRELYQQARNQMARGQSTALKQTLKELGDYPLVPYLYYQGLIKRMRYLPVQAVNEFLDNYPDTPLAGRLKHNWLRAIAKRGQWKLYLQEYANETSTELVCYSLWAKHKTGRTDEIMPRVEALWKVGRSQPKACDPLFKLWREAGNINDTLVWERFNLAMQGRKSQLARYLIRYMSEPLKTQAWLYREAYFQPQKLKNMGRFRDKSQQYLADIIFMGMTRLARRDPELALDLWPRYQSQNAFTDNEKLSMDKSILLGLAKKNLASTFDKRFAGYKYPDDQDIINAALLMALRTQDWQRIVNLVPQLPPASRSSSRWQYWLARGLLETSSEKTAEAVNSETSEQTNQALAIYQYLAKERDYYGFLAAYYLKQPYQLNHKVGRIDRDFLIGFANLPGVKRATELLYWGELTDARREWRDLSRNFDNLQHYSSAYYALEQGWHSQAIRSAIAAEGWHDMNLRFPLLFNEAFSEAANRLDLDINWLIAVARQESALTVDAVSHAGARGLMQLMPATAKEVARKHKINYRKPSALFDPLLNIQLASHYLDDMLERFDGNRVFATAAYNAGPHRVSRWLKDAEHMPNDVWIENIPFAETRQYVKNVLAYSVIFAQLRNEPNYQLAISLPQSSGNTQ